MRAAIDTNGLYTTQAGVARYIRGVLRGLRALPDPPDFFEFAWKVENFDYRQPRRAMKTFYRELIWGPYLANSKLRRMKADLVHATGAILYRPEAGVRHVVTLHDLAVLRQPARFRKWQVASARRQFKLLERAEKIICISQFTAGEAMALLQLPAKKLVVVHNGCDFQESTPIEKMPEKAAPSEFFLFVGSLEPGKNLNLLKEVYRLARVRGAALPPLLIVGSRWEGVPGEGAPPADWHYLGRQPDETLVYLYRRAQALLFPSQYEGFGLPVAEAMSLGCPVICSRVASLAEVGGEAVLYAGQNAHSYLDAMVRLLEDDNQRLRMIELGRAQSARFNWTKCARETVEVYKSVSGS
jgi:glycosyltransferase involved in cell wall biosynthesis